MRKKLVSLGIVLAAVVAASTITPAAADGPSTSALCPPDHYAVFCPDSTGTGVHYFCCPDYAMCVCAP